MKKAMFLFILLFILGGCNRDSSGGSISPYKNYVEVFNLDFIAFGVSHALETWGFGTIPDERIDLSEIDMNYINSPLGRSRLSLLTRDDITNLGILDENQKENFNDYAEETKSNAFKIGFCISNDLESKDKQIIWITNLDHFDNKVGREKLGYNLFYESKILDFNDILEKAKNAINVNELNWPFLNNGFTGIFLHNYINTENMTTLNFYVMTLEAETKASLVKFDINIERR